MTFYRMKTASMEKTLWEKPEAPKHADAEMWASNFSTFEIWPYTIVAKT